LERQFAK